jgi:hypothetical protein
MNSSRSHRRAALALSVLLLGSFAAPANAADPKASPSPTPTVDPSKPPSEPSGPTILAPIPGMSSAGPLTNIGVSADLNCSVNHEADAVGEFYNDTACATLVVVDGQLYGPAFIPAGGAAAPRVTFQAVSQVTSGSGTTDDPLKTVTTVNAGTTGSCSSRKTATSSALVL